MTSRKLPPAIHVRPPSGASFEVPLRSVRLTIGRSSRNDLCLNDPFVSRLHAEIRRDGEFFVLYDSGSANGTYHNGQRIDSSAALQFGDVIRIGETELRVADGTTTASGSYKTPLAFRFTEGGQTAPTERLSTHAIRDVPPSSEWQAVTATSCLPPPATQRLATPNWLPIFSKVVETLAVDQSLEETLDTILGLAFEAIAPERAYLLLRDEHGQLQLQAHRTTQQTAHLEVTLPWSIHAHVLQDGKPILVSQALQGGPYYTDTPSASLIAAPLLAGGEVLGLLYMDNPFTPTHFDQNHLDLLTTIARVAAIKIENTRLLEARLEKRRFEEELQVASEIQLSLHPSRPPQLAGWDIAGLSFPCREIGGDYYDFIPRGNGKLILAVGDVAGKGMGAALMMSSVHAALRAQAQTARTLADIVAAVNDYLVENSPENKFLTLFCAELDPVTGILHYTSAGHDPALLVHADGTYTELPAQGIPMGITPNVSPAIHQVCLTPGDILAIYTDGLTESMNEEGDILGLERLVQTIVKNRGLSASRLRDRVEEAVSRFVGRAPAADDLTLVLLRRLPT
ncbi:SpoIIE family protein phosphatase [Chloracidobacterium thermophilum]|jgi:sigma-B regulation protein RsbU (phosphoserine phosphatase)|uniref:Serine phosphatase RsbU, regulator of sigma subunit n=1 Tax=Chloracidobacterium thermophilum (strain B) TaxID=981222 RepID=G2LDS6_CHLTF|nr:SpoIIE family protein phosphatase [Chloracidobacterium thermophilum]AEP12934.1 Serine phosphatase RsbU, regulator of sigma subunit [Chloracidobacterium thermophilum B]QUV78653.1 SpoIIE family protein phosphatase [Chloracidobacterium thermophilum]